MMNTNRRGGVAVAIDIKSGLGQAVRQPPWRRSHSSTPSAGSASETSSEGSLVPKQPPQQRLIALMRRLEDDDGPTYFSYPVFLLYLMRGAPGMISGDFEDTMVSTAKQLRTAAGGDVYLADGQAYIRESLSLEFPEFKVFQITIDESFAESNTCPGIWIETQHFADLRALARMRRAIQKTHPVKGLKAVAVVQALLGLTD